MIGGSIITSKQVYYLKFDVTEPISEDYHKPENEDEKAKLFEKSSKQIMMQLISSSYLFSSVSTSLYSKLFVLIKLPRDIALPIDEQTNEIYVTPKQSFIPNRQLRPSTSIFFSIHLNYVSFSKNKTNISTIQTPSTENNHIEDESLWFQIGKGLPVFKI